MGTGNAPSKYGGIGLSSAVQLAPSAFLASAAGSEKLISEILPEDTHLDDELLFLAIEHWHALSDADSTVVIKEPAAQKDWSAAVNKQKFARIQLVNAINETPRARVLAYQGKIAGAWLNAYPSKAIGLKLTEQIRISLGLRLGVPLCEPHFCSCGSEVRADGRHGLSCKKSSGRFPRHSMINDIIKRALTSAGLPFQLEPVGLTRSDGKRADGVTLIPWFRGASLAWDATVVDALAPSNILRSSNHPGSTVIAAEERKTTKYQELTDRGYIFQPIAFEVQGRAGPSTEKFLFDLGKRLIKETQQEGI